MKAPIHKDHEIITGLIAALRTVLARAESEYPRFDSECGKNEIGDAYAAIITGERYMFPHLTKK